MRVTNARNINDRTQLRVVIVNDINESETLSFAGSTSQRKWERNCIDHAVHTGAQKTKLIHAKLNPICPGTVTSAAWDCNIAPNCAWFENVHSLDLFCTIELHAILYFHSSTNHVEYFNKIKTPPTGGDAPADVLPLKIRLKANTYRNCVPNAVRRLILHDVTKNWTAWTTVATGSLRSPLQKYDWTPRSCHPATTWLHRTYANMYVQHEPRVITELHDSNRRNQIQCTFK